MSGEVTNRDLLSRWQSGDETAAQMLVDRYLVRLTALARSRLSRRLARRVEAEDIVLSAWRSFFVATGRGRLTVPADDNLWPVLVTLTLRKLSHQAARHQAEQRDVDREQTLTSTSDWMQAVSHDPGPEEAIALIDELEHLLAQLTPQDREIVSRRLQGEVPAAIATELGCAERTVRRAIQRVRWIAEQRKSDSTYPTALRSSNSDDESADMRSSGFDLDPLESSFEFGELTLEQIIGLGGFGKLYRAHDRTNDRTVAVKFLLKSLWRDERAVDALLRENRVVSQLQHPGIIRHYGWGRTPAGAVFVVMEWIDGRDLSAIVRCEQLPMDAVIRYSVEIAQALIATHAAGIVHGDLTPANVLLSKSGRVVLTDFGFARMVQRNVQYPRGGTPGFLAPEQISDSFGRIDERTDVYGFGGLMYALLTGGTPMPGPDVPAILANVLSSQPARNVQSVRSDVSLSLASLIGHCLEKEPKDRPSSMVTVLNRLGECSAERCR